MNIVEELVSKCHAYAVGRVYASTQYGMRFILAANGPNAGGIVYRDDVLTHSELETLADKINAALFGK